MTETDAGWIDVSRPLTPGIPVWPGDTEWQCGWAWEIAKGASVNVAAFGGSTHTGTHVEGALHVLADGTPIQGVPLDRFVGSAWVARLEPGAEGPIVAADLERALAEAGAADEPVERLLVAAGCDWSGGVPVEFRAPDPAAAGWCVERGVRLFGTDAPSVDPFDSKALEAHKILVGGNGAILESVALAGIEPGRYALAALPLPLVGADASPVRAVLRKAAP